MNKLTKISHNTKTTNEFSLDFIDLSGKSPIANGTKRVVYSVPGNEDLVVKLFRADQTPDKQRSAKIYRKINWLRDPIVFNQNKYDLRELTKHHKKYGDIIWNFFPKTELQLVKTSEGEGLVQLKIKNADGTLSPSVEAYVADKGYTDQLKSALMQLKNFLSVHHIVIRDLSIKNLIVQNEAENNLKIVMIDGFGNSDIIKLVDYSNYLNDQKLNRKFDRLTVNIEKI